jgi:molybdopterin/thiamine biosynthesis adenylyltransferase
MIRLAILEETTQALLRHLGASASLEEGAFCLLRESRGREGRRLVAGELILPPPGAWEIQERDALRPSAKWVSAVISRAVTAEAGLLFVHSHPRAKHPAGFSGVDRHSLEALGETLEPMLDGPFAAAVVHETSWAGAQWEDDRIRPIERIVSAGSGYRALTKVSAGEEASIDARQRDALGIVHDRVRGLSVGLVGCGGLGSPMAEQLVRMGAATVVIVDDDVLDTDSNVRRVFGSTAADLRATTPPAKVDVVGRHLDHLQLGTRVERVRGDVRVETVFRTLLDCDVVLCGTDTHGSRAIVNELPYAYLLPVIDVGVRVGSRAGSLSGLLAELRLLTPDRPCLWCRGAIDADTIRAENLPDEERRQLREEGYVVEGVGEPVPSVAGLTVLGAGMGICALLAVLSDDGDVIPSGYWFDGMFGDARETQPAEPRADCRCRRQLALADAAVVPFIPG